MSEGAPDKEATPTDPADADADTEAQRQRRRARVFGEVLPDTTTDERGDASQGEGDTDDWLRRQVPPHHG